MRVGLVADKLNINRGGSNFSLDLLARELSDRGHRVTVITVNFAFDNALPETYPYCVVEAPIGNRTRIGDAKEIYSVFERHEKEVDIYHVFNPALLPIAGWFRRRHDTPVVGLLNNYDIFCTNLTMMDGECHTDCTVAKKMAHADRSPFRNLLNVPKYVFDTAMLPGAMGEVDRLFALSPAVQRVYEAMGVASDRITVIGNLYDPSFEVTDSNHRPFDKDCSILYVGNLRRHKGVELLVNCANSLPDDISIEIVGDGPIREQLERKAVEQGVGQIVTFHGWVDHAELPAYYRDADIFVHPGLWPEPFGRTLLEAMQHECALVVSDIGGPPWVIGDAGVTFARGDLEGLRGILGSLLADQDRLTALQRKGAERLMRFTPDRVVSTIESQYRSLG